METRGAPGRTGTDVSRADLYGGRSAVGFFGLPGFFILCFFYCLVIVHLSHLSDL